ncbi:MAG: FAD-dependent oxidoreductase, partial [Planctomycetaceae bacterium]|nr:FAD-dependent oxidoreductase [Planctomycetaceae bacterium]
MQPPLSRRALLGAAAGSFLAADSFLYGKDATGGNAQQLTEPQRTVPYAQDCDVIVCGGGPAGIAAAISAA